jgi:hypothetical protein
MHVKMPRPGRLRARHRQPLTTPAATGSCSPGSTDGDLARCSYGAALARHLTAQDVLRSADQTGRSVGDTARATSSTRSPRPAPSCPGGERDNEDARRPARLLKMLQRSGNKARTQAINQLRAVVLTAPDELRSGCVSSTARWRPAAASTGPTTTAGTTPDYSFLREPAQRTRCSTPSCLTRPHDCAASPVPSRPTPWVWHGVGPDTASTAHRRRVTTQAALERSFAGTAREPDFATSGKRQNRHHQPRRRPATAPCGASRSSDEH